MEKKTHFWTKILRENILINFFKINLTSIEKEIAIESIEKKYAPSLKKSIINAILIIPAILFLDSTTIVSVLIPITLVAGTAWFSISLSSIKKKFEDFGLELTTNVFESFTTSLLLLILIASVSLGYEFLLPIITFGQQLVYLKIIAALLGIFVICRNIFQIFVGSLKYDINDAMLTGQNEAAEKFFKKSLSFLNITAENLRSGKHIQVANYYIGLSFFEIFTYIKSLNIGKSKELENYINSSNELINNPSMKQQKADKIAINLTEIFLEMVKIKDNEAINKSKSAIIDEITNLKKPHSNEAQAMIDTRMSIIFQEISEMIDSTGESLFK